MFSHQRIICCVGRTIVNNNRNTLPLLRQNTKSFVLSTNNTFKLKPYNFIPKQQTNTTVCLSNNLNTLVFKQFYSTNSNYPETAAQKLKKAVAEYGSVVIVFHIGISLLSLGVCYTLISSGLDLTAILSHIGLDIDTENKLATNAGTFVVAYAVHKVFAPVRIGVTLTSAPFIVNYLRKIGWLKQLPKKIN